MSGMAGLVVGHLTGVRSARLEDASVPLLQHWCGNLERLALDKPKLLLDYHLDLSWDVIGQCSVGKDST